MISRRSLLSQVGVLAAGGAGAWWLRDHVVWPRARATFGDSGRTSGWLAFDAATHPLALIEVRVNGQPVRALVDSGAQATVVDKALAESLGLSLSLIAPVMAFGVSGVPQVGRSARLNLEAGALAFDGLRAAVLDLAPIAAASGRSFSLVIGQDVFRTVVADFDFPNGRVAFHDPASFVLPLNAVGVPARDGGRGLLTTVLIEGAPFEVVLDTGASGALALSPEIAHAAGLFDGRRVGVAPSITFGGAAYDQTVTVEALRFAGRTFEDVLVHIYAPPNGGPAPPGLLGVAVLEADRVLIDYAHGGLHLVPGSSRRRAAGPAITLRRNRR